MIIARDRYLQKIIRCRKDGQIKIITGIRRCGKSILLNEIFRDYLLGEGVKQDQIIMLALDSDVNIQYRNPIALGQYIRNQATDTQNIIMFSWMRYRWFSPFPILTYPKG